MIRIKTFSEVATKFVDAATEIYIKEHHINPGQIIKIDSYALSGDGETTEDRHYLRLIYDDGKGIGARG